MCIHIFEILCVDVCCSTFVYCVLAVLVHMWDIYAHIGMNFNHVHKHTHRATSSEKYDVLYTIIQPKGSSSMSYFNLKFYGWYTFLLGMHWITSHDFSLWCYFKVLYECMYMSVYDTTVRPAYDNSICPLHPLVFNPHPLAQTMTNDAGEPCVCVCVCAWVHSILCYYLLAPLNLICVNNYCMCLNAPLVLDITAVTSVLDVPDSK